MQKRSLLLSCVAFSMIGLASTHNHHNHIEEPTFTIPVEKKTGRGKPSKFGLKFDDEKAVDGFGKFMNSKNFRDLKVFSGLDKCELD